MKLCPIADRTSDRIPDRPFWALTSCKTPVGVRHQQIVGLLQMLLSPYTGCLFPIASPYAPPYARPIA